MINPRGHSTYMRYDLLGRQTHTIDALGGVSYMGYDATGNVVLREGPEESNLVGIYTVSSDLTTIRRCGLDGLNSVTIASGETDVGTLAVDLTTPGGKLYWLGNNYGKRSNLDGSNPESILDSSDVTSAGPLALDLVRRRLYFSDVGNEEIRSTTMEGGDLQTVLATTGQQVFGLAIDAAGSKLYYTRLAAGDLRRVNLDGTGDESLVGSLSVPVGVALDLVNRKVYWVERDGGLVRRANLDGTSAETVLSSLTLPFRVAVDPVRGRVYWVELGTTDVLKSATLAGTGAQTLVSDAEVVTLLVPQRVTLSTYDGLNRQSKVIDALGSQTYMGYDSRSSAVLRLDADGRATYMAHDPARRVEKTWFANPVAGESADSPIYYGYDQVGNVRITDDRVGGIGVSYHDFDKMDRVTKKFTLGGAVYYAYDLSGIKTSLKDADLQENVYVYDAAGRLTTLQVAAGRSAYYHYDASGLATTRLLPGNDVQAYMSYDVAGRLLDLVNHNPTNGVLSSNVYTRNENGAITKIVQQFGQHTYYDYDALDRQTRDFVFDGFDTVRDNRYSYDVASNRSTKSDLVAPSETYYAHDARNLLTSEHVLSGATAYYDHDASQRMTRQRSSSEATYFAHSQRDQVSRVQHAAASPDLIHYFSYNGTGERVRVREGAAEAYWSHDGSKLMAERKSTGTTAKRYRHNTSRVAGGIVEVEANDLTVPNNRAHPAYNEDGSVVQLATSSDIPESYTYDRFGVTSDSGATTQRARYVSDGLIALATTQDIYLTPGGLYLPRVSTWTVAAFGLFFNMGPGSGLPLEGPYDPWGGEEESHDPGAPTFLDTFFGALPGYPGKRPWPSGRFRRRRRKHTPGPVLPPIRDGGEAPPFPEPTKSPPSWPSPWVPYGTPYTEPPVPTPPPPPPPALPPIPLPPGPGSKVVGGGTGVGIAGDPEQPQPIPKRPGCNSLVGTAKVTAFATTTGMFPQPIKDAWRVAVSNLVTAMLPINAMNGRPCGAYWYCSIEVRWVSPIELVNRWGVWTRTLGALSYTNTTVVGRDFELWCVGQ